VDPDPDRPKWSSEKGKDEKIPFSKGVLNDSPGV
jgi:hypothetical protein